MRRSEQRLRAAVLAAPYSIMLHAEDGEVLEISRKWTELTGYTREQIKTHFDWIALACSAEEQEHLQSAVAREFDLEGEAKVGEREVRIASNTRRTWHFQNVGLGRLPDDRAAEPTVISRSPERSARSGGSWARADRAHAARTR